VIELASVTGRSEAGIVEMETLFKWNKNKYDKGLANFPALLTKRNRSGN
jgi:pilus assembly protein CpaF